jgi:hypothetical protein
MKSLTFIISLSIFNSAFACYAPSGALEIEHSRLVVETPTIALATAISSVPEQGSSLAKEPGIYTFKVIETLKGTPANEITLRGDLDLKGLWDTTFSNHNDKEFWVNKSGRLGNIGDCVTTPPPEFIIGKNYLLLIGGPDDSKKFERIDSSQDKWLVFVKSNLRVGI